MSFQFNWPIVIEERHCIVNLWQLEKSDMAHNYVDGVTDVCINWDDVDGEYCAGSVYDKIIVDLVDGKR